MYSIGQVSSTPLFTPKTSAASLLERRADPEPLENNSAAPAPILSTLARQLSECAERAAVRDKTLSRDALREVASRVSGQLSCSRYTRGDLSQVFARSSTDDPELVQRDIQAVRYSVSSIYRQNSVPSPFAGLSREDLVLIAYDESDTFTINERYAAWRDAYQLEQDFREDYCRRSFEGAFNQHPFLAYAEILIHHRSIPLIEQVQCPEGYEAKIERWMLEAWAEKPPIDSDDFQTLFEILAYVLNSGRSGLTPQSDASIAAQETGATPSLPVSD